MYLYSFTKFFANKDINTMLGVDGLIEKSFGRFCQFACFIVIGLLLLSSHSVNAKTEKRILIIIIIVYLIMVNTKT